MPIKKQCAIPCKNTSCITGCLACLDVVDRVGLSEASILPISRYLISLAREGRCPEFKIA